MSGARLRDRLWLWGMKVNALQETEDYRSLGFAPSTLSTEQAIGRTGIVNVLMAGGVVARSSHPGCDAVGPPHHR